ncbi:preprotein translocase subunit YajC [Arcanobacterium urinimassiliense]|uniref:preprotein translocase subunit YajC n=1 Tax=Arcanobacterium urinimassiliense TaxID=1871014 RepID=UPI00093FCCC1|nr:preprotein translocase subunit YajC [Arcanobacterium urinimassiliense]
MELIIIVLFMVIMMWGLNFMNRKTQKRQQDERASAIVLGNSVVTTAGFLGKIVDIDGDAITLESPSGEESVWLRGAIAGQMEIPVAGISEADAAALDAEASAEEEVAAGEDSENPEAPEQPMEESDQE